MTKDKALKYINAFYKEHCRVSEEKQPHFWDAVAAICENPDCDKYSLGLIEENNFCIKNDFEIFYRCVPAPSVVSYAIQIAQEIITIDSTPVDAFDLFIINKRLEAIEKNVSYVRSRYTLES